MYNIPGNFLTLAISAFSEIFVSTKLHIFWFSSVFFVFRVIRQWLFPRLTGSDQAGFKLESGDRITPVYKPWSTAM